MENLVDQMISILVLALTTLVTGAVPLILIWLKRKWGLEVDEKQRAQLTSAIQNGIKYGAAVAKDAIKTRAVSNEDLHDFQLHATQRYLETNAPGSLKYFNTSANSAAIEKKIIAQMPTVAEESGAHVTVHSDSKPPL